MSNSPATEEEFIHTPDSNDPHWSESYGHWLYSPENSIGLFFHLQRSTVNPDMWQETIIIHRPDGTKLVGKSHGINTDGRNPAANGLIAKCLEPYKSWEISFNGALREVLSSDLHSNVLEDGVNQAAQITLECEEHADLWAQEIEPGSMQGFASAHFEQPLRFSGEIRFAGETTSVAGLGLRDHSYGPRKAGKVGDVQWFHGQFPSGRCFLVTRFCTADGKTYDTAHVTDSNGVHDAELVEISPIEHAAPGKKMHMVLKSELGTDTIRGEFIYTAPVSLMGVREQVPGRKPANGDFFYYDGNLRYTWNDDGVGYGAGNVVISKATQEKLEGKL